MRIRYFACGLLMILAACDDTPTDSNVPQSQIEARQSRNGSMTGDDNGFVLIGPGRKQEEGGGVSPIGVNSYLWRATLDTLSFMPLVSADPFGGVIITDWYEDPKTPGERFKVSALILDRALRADGVKITVFKQFADKRGGWREQQADDKLQRSLEDTILTRARQMKVSALSER